jgi:thioredoxin 1
MSQQIMEIDDSTFKSEVLEADSPVLVDFWAPWCGPCKAIGPVLDELSQSFGEQIKFTKCNVDNSPVTPGKYGIRSIPTLILFKNGEIVDQITGMVAKTRIEETLKKAI